jgi:hypothetical protein
MFHEATAGSLSHFDRQDLLLALPTEIKILILLNLDTNEFLSLRLVSRALRDAVEDCAAAYVRRFVREHMCDVSRALCPPPGPGRATLWFLLDASHRLTTSRALSRLLCASFGDKLKLLPPRPRPGPGPGLGKKRRDDRRRAREGLVAAVTPLVFALGHFFEAFRGAILARAVRQHELQRKAAGRRAGEGAAMRVSTGGSTVWYDQERILEPYAPELLLECYQVYGHLVDLLQDRLGRGAVTRALRGLTGALPRGGGAGFLGAFAEEIETLVLLGGFDAVVRVLGRRTRWGRRKAVGGFVGGLRPPVAPSGVKFPSDVVPTNLKPAPVVRPETPAERSDAETLAETATTDATATETIVDELAESADANSAAARRFCRHCFLQRVRRGFVGEDALRARPASPPAASATPTDCPACFSRGLLRWRANWAALGADLAPLGPCGRKAAPPRGIPADLHVELPAAHLVLVPSALKLLVKHRVVVRVDFQGWAAAGARSSVQFINAAAEADGEQFADPLWDPWSSGEEDEEDGDE